VRNVGTFSGGKAVTGAMGVWLELIFGVKSIFQKNIRGIAEIARVYAMFSPVLPYKARENPQPLAFPAGRHNYM
jgi:hypothetical protein